MKARNEGEVSRGMKGRSRGVKARNQGEVSRRAIKTHRLSKLSTRPLYSSVRHILASYQPALCLKTYQGERAGGEGEGERERGGGRRAGETERENRENIENIDRNIALPSKATTLQGTREGA
jgi:hypothetical protein